MLNFARDGCCFTLRAAAVIVRERQVLLHRMVDDNFWSLPGGRCEMLETSARCAEREVQEELGVPASTQRPLWIAETFFAHAGETHHQLALYHLVELPSDCLVMSGQGPFSGSEGHLKLEFHWFDLCEVPELELYPRFLRSDLLKLPPTPEHRVEWDLPHQERPTS